MLFAVRSAGLVAAGIMGYLTVPLGRVFAFIGIDYDLTIPVVQGFFETALGSQSAARAAAPLIQRAMVASLVIGWSGLSVHSQVSVMVLGTKIRMVPYVLARLVHGAASAAFTWLLLGPASAVASWLAGGKRLAALCHH